MKKKERTRRKNIILLNIVRHSLDKGSSFPIRHLKKNPLSILPSPINLKHSSWVPRTPRETEIGGWYDWYDAWLIWSLTSTHRLGVCRWVCRSRGYAAADRHIKCRNHVRVESVALIIGLTLRGILRVLSKRAKNPRGTGTTKFPLLVWGKRVDFAPHWHRVQWGI